MFIFKKSLSLLLGGVLAASAHYSQAYAVQNTSVNNLLSGNMKSTVFSTYYNWEYDPYETAARGSRQAVYNIYAKVDTAPFNKDDYTVITTHSSEIINKVSCVSYNADGSYIKAAVENFEPKQVDHFYLLFPVNGNYKCSVTASTGVTASYTLKINEAGSAYDSSDKKPPKLKITIPQISRYVPGEAIAINIESNELCSLELDGTTYNQCTGADFKVYSDGVYTVKAVDFNGNPTTQSFTVDVISKATTTTTTTTRKTTTTTTVTQTQPAATLCGDANMDGKLSIADASAILQYLGNPDKYYLSSTGRLNADCSNPGSGITVNDAIAIQKYDAKLIFSLPEYN